MIDIVGVHRGVHYQVAYDGDHPHWSRTFCWGNERFRGEGHMTATFIAVQDANAWLHAEVHRYIDGVLLSERFVALENEFS